MTPLFQKLDRLLTAIAYAEAGNLDAVKEILDQGETEAGEQRAVASLSTPPDAPAGRGAEGAKILEFKRAKPAF